MSVQWEIDIRDHTFMKSMKNVQFLHPPPLLSFLSVRMGPNWATPRHPWTSKHMLPTLHPPPLPESHHLWYFCSILIIFSRRFHQIPCPCNSQLFFTNNNQFKFNSIFCKKTQANTSHLEC